MKRIIACLTIFLMVIPASANAEPRQYDKICTQVQHVQIVTTVTNDPFLILDYVHEHYTSASSVQVLPLSTVTTTNTSVCLKSQLVTDWWWGKR